MFYQPIGAANFLPVLQLKAFNSPSHPESNNLSSLRRAELLHTVINICAAMLIRSTILETTINRRQFKSIDQQNSGSPKYLQINVLMEELSIFLWAWGLSVIHILFLHTEIKMSRTGRRTQSVWIYLYKSKRASNRNAFTPTSHWFEQHFYLHFLINLSQETLVIFTRYSPNTFTFTCN